MLDQLVAFCGERISEADVLNVFGFTGQQTVADLTDKILHGATADAVQLLHDQCESGKDMMKLMSDLIAYLRDLLVYKVKPDALTEDVDTDLQKSLSAQASLVETDRLLELIDGFAEAEGRMKWAPNKKLHFEVALIKAIQTLGQVTLNEVIENLNALRDGKSVPAAKKTENRPNSSNRRASAESSKKAPTSTAPAAKEQASEPDSNPEKMWEQVCARIPAHGFLRTLVDSLTVIGSEGRSFILGYPPEEKSAIETLATTSNRRQLETLLKEIGSRDWTVKLEPREGLQKRKPPQSSSPRAEEFKDDPLIQEALEMFKGEIRS
jgi:DNA polymerase III gamma/tau subunit